MWIVRLGWHGYGLSDLKGMGWGLSDLKGAGCIVRFEGPGADCQI